MLKFEAEPRSVSHAWITALVGTACAIVACTDARQRSPIAHTPEVADAGGDSGAQASDASGPQWPAVFDAAADGGSDAACGRIELRASRLTPAVHFLVDSTSTLNVSFPGGGPPRWEVLVRALLDSESGIVPALESNVLFSLTLFKSLDGGDEACPVLTRVPLALDNASAMRAACEAAVLSGGAPAAPALQYVAQLAAAERHDQPVGRQRIVLVVAEFVRPCDYAPDYGPCMTLPAGEAAACQVAIDLEQRLVAMESLADAAAEAYALGLEVLVLNLTEPDSAVDRALRGVANEGVGLPRNGAQEAPLYFVGDIPALERAVIDITEAAATCDLAVEGRIVLSRACEGEVTLDGEPLTCDEPDGWRPIDEARIELLGRACEAWRNAREARLQGSFPCGALLAPE